jgi:hypothetical protein
MLDADLISATTEVQTKLNQDAADSRGYFGE